MRTCFLVAGLPLVMGGCDLVSPSAPPPPTQTYSLMADTNFARTSAGYVNSGLLSNGRLYIWDRQAKTISYLTEVDVSMALTNSEPPGNMRASNLYGIRVTGDATVPPFVKTQAELELQKNASFELSNFTAETIREPAITLNDFLNQSLSSENRDDRAADLLLKQAADNDRYRYLFVFRMVRADKADFAYKGQSNGEVTFSLPVLDSVSGGVTVKVQHDAMVKFSGKQMPGLVSISVYKLGYQTNADGTFYRFSLDPEANTATLTDELRQM